ncbi:MAG: DUF2062 domain-containing protein [Verrucomicrobiae bacterium]
MKKLFAYFAALGRKLLELRDSPHAIAGGVAIGIFIGFTPLFGVKTLLCLGLAYLLRCSKIAAVIAVSLHDVVAPFWPIMLKIEYEIGAAILCLIHQTPPAISIQHFHISELMKWTTFLDVGLPLLVGSLFISAPTAVISYAGMLGLLQFRERRRAARAGGTKEHRRNAEDATDGTEP